ncbi:MAG: AsmA family protein [Acetobacteraceae bacterium]|nr:AsmA family protein [Acetobacteraceae bacterium]
MAKHPWRTALIGLAGLVVLAGIVLGVWVARLDPNDYKPRIAQAVRAATGRDLALNGPISLSWSPLGITLRDVALANPPGFSAPWMATVRQVTLRLDLGSLLRRRIVVRQLDINRPAVALERNAAGVPNWVFAPTPEAAQASPPPEAGAGAPEPRPDGGIRAAVLDARVSDGALTYRDARGGPAYSLAIPTLTVSAASPDAPLHLEGQAALAGTTLLVNADTGPSSGFPRGAFWPLRLGAKFAGQGGEAALEITAAGADQPVRAAVQGSARDTPFTATASLGTPAALASAGPPLPFSLEAQAAGAKLALSGTVAQPTQMAGLDAALSAHVPDLAALSGLTGRSLPRLRDLALSARLADLKGLRAGVALRGLRVAAPQGDLAGSAEAMFAPRPTLRADLAGTRLDLAALRAAVPPPAPAAPPPTRATPAAPGTPAPSRPVIPDTPLPFAALRAADADLRLRVGTLGLGAESLRAVEAHLGLASGALSFSARGTFAAAPVALTATADGHDPPNLALALNAPALPVATLLAAAGEPRYVVGTLAVTANLRGSGASPHAIAASLTGTAAATMRGGAIETQVLQRALGPVLAQGNPLAALGGGGPSELRCLAARARATHGVAELAPLLLASSLLTIDGTGRVDLARETLDLHLQPQGRASGVSFSVPVTVTGGFRAPRFGTSQPAAAAAGLQAALGLLAGKGGLGVAPAGPSCDAALAAARG